MLKFSFMSPGRLDAKGAACLESSTVATESLEVPVLWKNDTCCTMDATMLHLLVVTVAASTPAEQDLVSRSAISLAWGLYHMRKAKPLRGSPLDYLVIAHDNLAKRWQPRRVKGVLDFAAINGGLPAGVAQWPKFALVAAALPQLRARHGRRSLRGSVWVVDADIDFSDFNAAHFFRRWLCSFPGGRPLVSQPTIRARSNTRNPTGSRARKQLWWPLHAETWEPSEAVFAKAFLSDFVEMQAPLFHAPFFVSPVVSNHHATLRPLSLSLYQHVVRPLTT